MSEGILDNRLNMITVIVPVKNEQAMIAECLDRLNLYPKVIVVDSGSSDQTCEIADRYHNVQVVNFSWNGKYPKKRNWALENCNIDTEWVLFLDADEIISQQFTAELINVLPKTSCNGFWLTFDNYFMGKKLKYGDKFRKSALVRYGHGMYEYTKEDFWSNLDMEVHEPLVIEGEEGTIISVIEHKDKRGLKSYYQKHNEYASWEVGKYHSLKDDKEQWQNTSFRRKIKYSLLNSWFFPPLHFFYSYFFKLGIFDGLQGLIFAFVKSHYYYQILFKMIEYKLDNKSK